jgi:Sigma-70 factor, region 1.1
LEINHRVLDAGGAFGATLAQLVERFPQHAEFIHAFDARWLELLGGAINPTVAIFERLKQAGVPVLIGSLAIFRTLRTFSSGMASFSESSSARRAGSSPLTPINSVLPSKEVSHDQIEDTMSMLSDMGMTVVETRLWYSSCPYPEAGVWAGRSALLEQSHVLSTGGFAAHGG